MNWLRKEPHTVRGAVNATSPPKQILPYDPMRYWMVLSSDGTAPCAIDLCGEGSPGAYIYLLPGDNMIVLSEDQLGGGVTLPVFAYAPSGATAVQWIVFSYNGNNYRIYQELIHEYLSKYRTS
jgi:hypothetical protein